MTLPNNYKSYVHRVGRTARAGAQGRSISLVGEAERFMLKTIHKSAKSSLKVIKSYSKLSSALFPGMS